MIYFGPSGNADKFYSEGHKTTIEAMSYVQSMGLNAYEYSFGRGVNISDEKAMEIGKAAKLSAVKLSVHAPYYINLANADDAMIEKSYGYLLNSGFKAKCFNADRVVFHAAAVGKVARQEAVELCMQRLKTFINLAKQNGLSSIYFCPETMGKINQIGTTEEIAEMCRLDEMIIPTIDFGHLNARTQGGIHCEQDYIDIIRFLIDKIGYDKVNNMHIHFSKIEYSAGGEVRHLTFEDNNFGPDFLPLAKVLNDFNLSPTIICESSGTQDIDALQMKMMYNNYKENNNERR